MKSVIRWKGLIAFVIVTAGLLAFFTLFADMLLERSIESTGTKIVGARVELADADLSFFPSAVNLTGLQITDPDTPMKNAAEVTQINFSINLLDLLQKKIIINEMAVEGVRFNTDRKTTGAIKKRAKKSDKSTVTEKTEKKIGGFSLPSLESRDIKDILATEQLACLREVDQLQADIKTKEKEFRRTLETLPDEDKLKEYEAKIKKLENTKSDVFSILGGLSDASGVYKDIKADLAKLQAAKKDVQNTAADFEQRLNALPRLVQKDANRLKNKYGLTPQGIGSLTALIFGEQYAKWVTTGLQWYEKIKPYLAKAEDMTGKEKKEAVPPQPERGKGIYVPFRELSPRPDLLIRLAKVSVNTSGGDIDGAISDITNDQSMTGKPISFDFNAEKMKQLASLSVKGALDHTNPDTPTESFQVKIDKYQVKEVTISKDDNFPLTLTGGDLDLNLDGALTRSANGETITARSHILLRSAQFTGKDTGDQGRLESSLLNALTDVTKIDITTDISGPFDDYKVSVSSNLDKILKQALADVVRQESQAFVAKLQDQINAKLQDKLKTSDLQVGGLDAISNELTKRLNLGNRLLKM